MTELKRVELTYVLLKKPKINVCAAANVAADPSHSLQFPVETMLSLGQVLSPCCVLHVLPGTLSSCSSLG